MAFLLVCDDLDWALDIPVDPDLMEAITHQVARTALHRSGDTFAKRLAEIFPNAIAEALDRDLRRPTEPQIKFATAIAARLGLTIPEGALRYRGEMTNFIEAHVEAFRCRRLRRTTLRI